MFFIFRRKLWKMCCPENITFDTLRRGGTPNGKLELLLFSATSPASTTHRKNVDYASSTTFNFRLSTLPKITKKVWFAVEHCRARVHSTIAWWELWLQRLTEWTAAFVLVDNSKRQFMVFVRKSTCIPSTSSQQLCTACSGSFPCWSRSWPAEFRNWTKMFFASALTYIVIPFRCVATARVDLIDYLRLPGGRILHSH